MAKDKTYVERVKETGLAEYLFPKGSRGLLKKILKERYTKTNKPYFGIRESDTFDGVIALSHIVNGKISSIRLMYLGKELGWSRYDPTSDVLSLIYMPYLKTTPPPLNKESTTKAFVQLKDFLNSEDVDKELLFGKGALRKYKISFEESLISLKSLTLDQKFEVSKGAVLGRIEKKIWKKYYKEIECPITREAPKINDLTLIDGKYYSYESLKKCVNSWEERHPNEEQREGEGANPLNRGVLTKQNIEDNRVAPVDMLKTIAKKVGLENILEDYDYNLLYERHCKKNEEYKEEYKGKESGRSY